MAVVLVLGLAASSCVSNKAISTPESVVTSTPAPSSSVDPSILSSATADASTGESASASASGGMSASPKLHTPAAGTPERKAILDALRVKMQSDLGQKVIFNVDHLAVKDGFAFVKADPRTPAGGKIDYRKTRYKKLVEQGVFDGGGVIALLRLKQGEWKIVRVVVGPTDVPYGRWWSEFGAPKAIFDYVEQP
jgi:hypothetical protein